MPRNHYVFLLDSLFAERGRKLGLPPYEASPTMRDAQQPPRAFAFLLLLEPSLALAAIALGARALAEPTPASIGLVVLTVLLALAPLPFVFKRIAAPAT